MPSPGVFIVIEGSDGSGKGTQFKILKERLEAIGHEVAVFDFPRYDQPSSHFVQNYLNGVYGQATSLSPYASSMFYALDRFEAAPEIREALDQGKVVLSNRYVGSNMGHQGTKFPRPSEKRAFFMWADNLEYELLGIPRPNVSVFLRVPADTAYELIKLKAERSYTKDSHDQHEADKNHLREAVATFDMLCQLFPKDFKAVDCARNGKLLSIPEINNKIWELIKPLLPDPKKSGQARTVQLAKPVEQTPDKPTYTEIDSRSTQLSGLALVELLGAGVKLKQLTEVQNDFYIPKALDKSLVEKYQGFMKNNATARADLRKKLNKLNDGRRSHDIQAALNEATPLAYLLAVDLDTSAVKVWPSLDEIKAIQPDGARTQKPLKPELNTYSSVQEENISLVKSTYRNESEALAELNFLSSGESHSALLEELDRMSYEEKLLKLRAVILRDQSARRAFRYSFETITDLPDTLELLLSNRVDGLVAQHPTIRFGYDIPAVVEDNGLGEQYSELFDDCLELYSQLQDKHPELAAYAVMQGHRWRWRLETNADLLAKPLGSLKPPSKKLVRQMRRLVSVANPIIGDYFELVSAGQGKTSSIVPKP